MPPTRDATTGLAAAMASRITRPKPSASDGRNEHIAAAQDARYIEPLPEEHDVRRSGRRDRDSIARDRGG
jgi:hypothetical protein